MDEMQMKKYKQSDVIRRRLSLCLHDLLEIGQCLRSIWSRGARDARRERCMVCVSPIRPIRDVVASLSFAAPANWDSF